MIPTPEARWGWGIRNFGLAGGSWQAPLQSIVSAAGGFARSSGMLTIGKLGANRGQLQYYERQVAARMED